MGLKDGINYIAQALNPQNSYILNYLKGLPPMDQAALATSMIPGIGDVLGVAADVSNMAQNPDQRTLANVLWLAAGAAPFVPSRSQVNAAVEPIRAYHGSPHDFDKFSMDAIGTGEGGQAYGHGLYFAESEDVARGYRDMFNTDQFAGGKNFRHKDGRVITDSEAELPSEIVEYVDSDFVDNFDDDDVANAMDNAADILQGRRPRHSGVPTSLQEHVNKAAGNISPIDAKMYAVDINASPDEFLDWNKPLSEQSEKVKQALRSLPDPKLKERIYGKTNVGTELSGSEIYDEIQRYFSPNRSNIFDGGSASEGMVDASSELGSLGIKGTRYLDADSRSIGEGTRNYVIFDESIISIAKKYGVAIPIAAAMVARERGVAPESLYQEDNET